MNFLSGPLETVAEPLNVLAHERCRVVLHYFVRQPSEVATLDELADVVAARTQQGADAARIRARLHHLTLPRLAEVGALEYDVRSKTARYRGRPELEALVTRLAERGRVPDVPA